MSSRAADFVVSEAGGVTLSVRPGLPFMAEGVRLENGRVVIFNERNRIPFDTDEETIEAVRGIDGLLLIEFPDNTHEAPREIELSLS